MQAEKGRARFPGLTFNVAGAELLRHRRCVVCRALRQALAMHPALPPCDAARRLQINIDECSQAAPTPAPAPAASPTPTTPERARSSRNDEIRRAVLLLGALRRVQDRLAADVLRDLRAGAYATDSGTCTGGGGAACPARSTPSGGGDGDVRVAYALCLLMLAGSGGGLRCAQPAFVPAAGVPAALMRELLPTLLPRSVVLTEISVNRLAEGEGAGLGEEEGADVDAVLEILPLNLSWRFVEQGGIWGDVQELLVRSSHREVALQRLGHGTSG